MKKTLSKIAAGTLVLLVLAGCSSAPSVPGYTGKATIEKSERHSRKGGCILTVRTDTLIISNVRVGRRTTCDGWNPGRVVTLNNGYLQK